RLNERGVHVERRLRRRMLRLNRLQKIAVHPPQARHALARRRDERPSGFPPRLLAGIEKPRKPPARRMRRGQRARPLPPPAPRLGAPLPPALPVSFRRSHQPAQTAVRLQPVEIVETLTPRKVQQEQRRHHLPIAPALGRRSPRRDAPPPAPARPPATTPNTAEAP